MFRFSFLVYLQNTFKNTKLLWTNSKMKKKRLKLNSLVAEDSKVWLEEMNQMKDRSLLPETKMRNTSWMKLLDFTYSKYCLSGGVKSVTLKYVCHFSVAYHLHDRGNRGYEPYHWKECVNKVRLSRNTLSESVQDIWLITNLCY